MLNFNRLPEIPQLLTKASVIAVVGLSPKVERPSNMVASYLINAGYTIIPVNPGHERIFNKRCYPSLLDIPIRIDIANIFRRSEDVGPIVDQAIKKECKAIWLQQGIVNHNAAAKARDNGLTVIMDRCIKIDHHNLLHQH